MQFSQIVLLMKQWFSQMLLHYSWSAVAAQAASLKLTHFFLGIPWHGRAISMANWNTPGPLQHQHLVFDAQVHEQTLGV